MLKRLTLRIKNSNFLKIQNIAEKNKRSVNGQIEFILENFINEYEKFNGKFDIKETIDK